MSLSKQNPKIPEGINVSNTNPLVDFFLMLLGVSVTVVTLVLLIGVVVRYSAPSIPFEYEVEIASFFLDKVNSEKQNVALDEDKKTLLVEAERAIQELGQKLALHAQLDDGMVLSFHLVDMPDVPNAFATIGGNVYVTTGLLPIIDSENALAMVVAHEIAHIKYRHPIQLMSEGLITQMLLSLIASDKETLVTQGIISKAGTLAIMSYSRKMEREADRAAVETLLRKYGHLKGAGSFFSFMLETSDASQWQEIFKTHPNTQSRLTEIERRTSTSIHNKEIQKLDKRLVDYIEEMETTGVKNIGARVNIKSLSEDGTLH